MNIIRLYDRLNSLSMREKHSNKLVLKYISNNVLSVSHTNICHSLYLSSNLTPWTTTCDPNLMPSIDFYAWNPKYEFELYYLFFFNFLFICFPKLDFGLICRCLQMDTVIWQKKSKVTRIQSKYMLRWIFNFIDVVLKEWERAREKKTNMSRL